MAGGGRDGKTPLSGKHAGGILVCGSVFPLSDLRFFMPSLTVEELRGNRSQWLYAVDVLIATQGEACHLPLPADAAERLFPSVRFRVRERSRHKSALVMQKYRRQQAREVEHDLETLFWQWQDMPFWQVIAEAGMAAREAGHAVREIEWWMVPNKLLEVA